MAHKTTQDRIDEAVDEAVRNERQRMRSIIRNYSFTADGYTYDVVMSVLGDIDEEIGE